MQTNVANNTLNMLDSTLNFNLNNLHLVDSLLKQNFAINLQNQRDSLMYLISNINLQLRVQRNNQDSIVEFSHLQSKQTNQNIIPANDIETNEKSVNNFYLKYYDTPVANIASNEIDEIKYIAQLCPFAYGKAVYRARSILHNMGLVEIYDDRVNCAALGYFRKGQSLANGNSTSVELTIAPNPTKEFVTIYFNDYQNIVRLIVVYDVYGKIVLEQQSKPCAELNVDLSDLSTGIYFVHDKKAVGHYVKLNIIK